MMNLRKYIYHGDFGDGRYFQKVENKWLHYHVFQYMLKINDMMTNI